MSASDAMKLIRESEAKFVDFRFTDTVGKERHNTFPVAAMDEKVFKEGKPFDGSSIAGWRGINDSDMLLIPDAASAVVDPFYQENTVNFRCDVVHPDMKPYERDPRSVAKKAEEYLSSSGVGDQAYFGPESEFFIFDSVQWGGEMGSAFYEIDSKEAAWNSAKDYKEEGEEGNSGHRPRVKGGYFQSPPTDSQADVRGVMCLLLNDMGVVTEAHNHEVGTAGQAEIGTGFNTMVKKADEVQILKYVVHNVAHNHNMTATFMPKPIVGDNGNGLHVNQSIFKGGKNIFDGKEYGNLSQEALYYIGGIFRHARALNAFTNASTNSYKRLVPGFEAPIQLAYSARNRSVSCRIPHSANPKGRRIEARFPDSSANPYFAFAALLMAGLDGIQNKIDPGKPSDHDLYTLPEEQLKKIPTVAPGLDVALEALDKDREFLKAGGVMSDDMIDGYIAMKMAEVTRLRMETHPCEFDMYYGV
ncbi:MAG: type I glutamate--ammonia ligase [Gammaproteobacteria bacterium]|nr:type I glutamate--ammonia ligase [Gammaproteobacteria bacterium]